MRLMIYRIIAITVCLVIYDVRHAVATHSECVPNYELQVELYLEDCKDKAQRLKDVKVYLICEEIAREDISRLEFDCTIDSYGQGHPPK